MNHLEPRTCHPYLWTLTEVLGLTLKRVGRETRISRPTLLRIREGHQPLSSHLEKLGKLIRQTSDAVAATISPPAAFSNKKLDRPFCFWHRSSEILARRKAEFDFINYVLAAYAPQTAVTPRQTSLSHELLLVVGRGRERDIVFAHFSSTRRKALRKCAKRIGVRERVTDGVTWWLPPRDMQPFKRPPLPEIPQNFRFTPRAQRIQNALTSYLYDHPSGAPSSEAISYTMSRAKCSRVSVYIAARDLCVVRHTTGFGPDKQTKWRLPPKPDES